MSYASTVMWCDVVPVHVVGGWELRRWDCKCNHAETWWQNLQKANTLCYMYSCYTWNNSIKCVNFRAKQEVDQTTSCGDGHLKFFQDGAGSHLGFVRTGNSVIRSAVSENPTLEPNMKWIGRSFAEIGVCPFEIFDMRARWVGRSSIYL